MLRRPHKRGLFYIFTPHLGGSRVSPTSLEADWSYHYTLGCKSSSLSPVCLPGKTLMPRAARPPAKMPQAFYLLLDRIASSPLREVHIPISSEQERYIIRGQLQEFLRSLERHDHPRSAEAQSLMVRHCPENDPRGFGLLVCDRDRSPAAQAVLAALGMEDSGGQNAESSLSHRLLSPQEGSDVNLSSEILPIVPSRIPKSI